MLACQRHLFDIPGEVAYLNAASMSPLPRAVIEAGRIGAARKGKPWLISDKLAGEQCERARSAAARIIGAAPDDIAIIPSVSYGVAIAAKTLDIPARSRVLVMADDHSSPVLEWMSRAPVQNFAVEVVTKGDGWTSSLLEAIERPGSSPVSLASISSVHWGDGGAIGLEPVAQALRARGAAFLVDATQSAGVLPLDVASIDPDFVVFPTYKWLLGPYGRAFLYIAKRHQGGVPLEQTSFGRLSVNAERIPYFADLTYRPDARRFDMGERDYLITLEMASIGMEMMADWGSEAVSARLRLLTDRAAEGLGDCPGIEIPKSRAPNILSIAFQDGVDSSFVETLASRGVHVAKRLGRVRVSPHIYNDEADIDRFVSIVVSLMTSRGYPSSKPRLRQNLES